MLIVPGTIWLFDKFIRVILSRFYPTTKFVELEILRDPNVPNLNVVALTVVKTGMRFFPGSHVFLRVPEISLVESKPFSISSAPATISESHPDQTFTLHVLCSNIPNTWTNNLLLLSEKYIAEREALQQTKQEQIAAKGYSDVGSGSDLLHPYVVFVDGPYTSVDENFDDYKSIIMFAGGIGITPCMSLLQSHLNRIKTEMAKISQDKSCSGSQSGAPSSAMMAGMELDDLESNKHANSLLVSKFPKMYLIWSSRSKAMFLSAFPSIILEAMQPQYSDFINIRLYQSGNYDKAFQLEDVQLLKSNAGEHSSVPPFEPALHDEKLGQVAVPEDGSINSSINNKSEHETSTVKNRKQPLAPIGPHSFGANRRSSTNFNFSTAVQIEQIICKTGRPNVNELLVTILEEVRTREKKVGNANFSTTEVLVTACGPRELVDSVQKCAGELDCNFSSEEFEI
jgi:hypothetical protein